MSRVPWLAFGKLSILMLLAGLAIYVCRLPQLLANYTTAWPLSTFYIILIITMIFIAAVYVAGAILLLGLAWFFLGRAFGPGRIAGWRGWNAGYVRDAILIGIFGSAAVMGLNRLPALFARWPLLRHSLGASVPEGLDMLSPAVGSIASAIIAAFITAGVLGIAVALIAAYVRPVWMRAGLMIVYAVLMAANVATPGAFLRDAAYHLLAVAVLWYGVTQIVRFNALGYFLLAAMLVVVPGAVELLQQPNPALRANGYAVVACAIAILAWPLLTYRRR